MAFTTFLMTVSLVAIASAGFPGWPDEETAFPGFPPLMTLRFAGAPPLPSPPPMPNMKFPVLPSPPYFQFPGFISMPPLKFPPMSSIKDIPKGSTFNGMMFSSLSETKTDENGNLVKKGGSTVIINQDGKVTVHKTGDTEPDSVVTITSPQSEQNSTRQSVDLNDAQIKPTKPPTFEPFKPFKPFKPFEPFEPFKDFKPFDGFDDFPTFKPIEPISRDTIKNTVPDKNQKYYGHSVSSSTYFSDVNGVKKEGGSLNILNNDNGLVKEKNIIFHKDPTA